jgi:PAS domain S-box-containing protein
MRKSALSLLALTLLALSPLSAETIRVGVTLQPPLTSLNKDQKNPAGLCIDLLEDMAARKGWKLVYQVDSRLSTLNKLTRGELDLIVPAPLPLTDSDRLDYVPGAILGSHAQIVVLPNNRFSSLRDLNEKTIAVVRDDIHYVRFQAALQEARAKCQFIEMRSYSDVLQAVQSKRADGGLVDHFFNAKNSRQQGLIASLITTGPVDFHFAVAHNTNRQLLLTLEQDLSTLKQNKDSLYYQALSNWAGHRDPLSPLAKTGLILLSVLVGGGLIAGVILQTSKRSDQRADKLAAANRHLLKTVDDHLRREEAAEANKNWYRALLNNTPDAILIHGVDAKGLPGKFLEVNETACVRLGFSHEELLALSPRDIEINAEGGSSPRYAKLLSKWKDARLPGATQEPEAAASLTCELSFRTKNGEEKPFEVTLRNLDHEGKPIVYYHLHDITTRRKAQLALKESEQRFSDFFSRSPIGVALYSPSRELTDVNQAALAMFGLSERSAFSATRLLESGNLSPESQTVLSKGGTVRYENVIDFDEVKRESRYPSSRTGKSHFDILVTNLGLTPDFQPKGFMIQIQDMTEHRRAEETLHQHERMLRQAQKMEAIGTLAGGIAHDFNNILTPIIGYTEMAMLTAGPNDPILPNLEEVLKASHRAKELVKQILTFSRQTEHEVKPIRLIPLVKEVMQLLRGSVPPTIELRPQIQIDRDIVKADPTQMHQVIMNLCTNALHAMKDKGGVLEVGMRPVSVDSRTRGALARLRFGAYLEIYIRDTGHGMDRTVMDRIFEPFFTTKRSGEGTGMGLSVVHGIISSLQGIITVESEIGKGTTFHIFLPLIEQVAEQTATSTDPLPRGTEAIMFVDDEPGIVAMASQMLASLGYQVTTATRAKDALAIFKQEPNRFDLIITDQIMPGMTGMEMVREMHAIRRGLPALLCTGFSKTVSEENLLAEGIHEILMKPIVLRQTAEAIRNALDDPKSKGGSKPSA